MIDDRLTVLASKDYRGRLLSKASTETRDA
jgi:hypothetical protein